MPGLGLDPAAVTKDLAEKALDGWLILDFHGKNPVASAAVDVGEAFLSRRWALWLPKGGQPEMVVNTIEYQSLPDLGVDLKTYQNFEDWKATLDGWAGGKKIAIEWYPNGEIPYLSSVDGGLVGLLQSLGCELHSSAGLSQKHLVLWREGQKLSHRRSGIQLTDIVNDVFNRIRETPPGTVDERTVQSWIMDEFKNRGLTTDHAATVAIDGHAGDPHYSPQAEGSSILGEHFLLLIDLWATEPGPDAAFADITWMARRGDVSDEIEHGFRTVLAARDAGVAQLNEAWEANETLPGYAVDDTVRKVIQDAGLGEAFVHRTGHSLGLTRAHGQGANLDGYEARDTRPIEPGLAFTIEPGVYFPTWGIRSEINILMDPGPSVTTMPQTDWVVV